MGILSGLDQFGLGDLEGADLYADPTKGADAVEEEKAKEPAEADFLFDKTYTCPVCDKEFKTRTVKVGKAKLLGTDSDLRPKYDKLDSLKYDIILCPHCGYAALSRYFKVITPPQAKLVKENISKGFHRLPEKDVYDYDDALERYKLALANAIVKRGKASEKAYICLKMAWLSRAKGEALDLTDASYDTELAKCKADEMELLKSSLEGFLAARQSESFPMCGMDETTVDYLIAVTAIKFDKYDVASKLISGILLSPNANARMKDKARDLKQEILDSRRK
jgi:uncharacterized protein